MRLYHVSETPDIPVFHPRPPARSDLDPTVGLVWAIEASRLSNFLTPRNCPRIGYHVAAQTTQSDRLRYFTDPAATHGLVIESRWFEAMTRTVLYLYTFDSAGFELQDAAAGYYVARETQTPTGQIPIDNIFSALFACGAELHVVQTLWHIADAISHSTLDWSLCRMRNALPRNPASFSGIGQQEAFP